MQPLNQALPAPPRTLSRFTALRLLFHRARSSVVFLVGIIFLIVGAVLTVGITGGFWSQIRKERALLAQGDSTEAVVTAKRAYNQSDDTRVYELSYEFPLADGRTWSAARPVDQGEWNRLQVGDRMEVRYDRAKPDNHLMPAFSLPLILVLLGLMPLVFLGLGALLVRSGSREVFQPLRLYGTGDAASGRVTGFEVVTNERINRRHPVRVSYSFRDGSSSEHHGSIKTLDDDLLDVLLEGMEVTVLYDRQRPESNTLWAALGHPVMRGSSRRAQKGNS